MSMIGNFLAVSASKLDELIRTPEEVAEFIAEVSDRSDADGDFLDVHKSWHGIHFLLTGSTWEGAQPLRSVVLATRELGEDVGYGPARVLTAAEVAEVSRVLAAISPEQLKEK